jgi:hypothetical protein
LPSSAFNTSYLVLGREQTATESVHATAFVTIVAAEDDTEVSVELTARVQAGGSMTQNASPGDVIVEKLNRFDVWQISTVNDAADPQDAGGVPKEDLTGTIIVADKPIGVYSGAECAQVPNGTASCDHMEEQLFPVNSWGNHYIGVTTKDRADPLGFGSTFPDYWRIIAALDGTQVTTNPAQTGTPVTLNQGQFIEFESGTPFEVLASGPVLMGQFIASCGMLCSTSDPSFMLAVPVEQFRADHVFLTPPTFETNYITVLAPAGAAVQLDGAPLSGFVPVGNGFSYLYVSVSEGAHVLLSDQPVGIQVYGWGQKISYGYPGGLDLRKINDVSIIKPGG